MYVFIYTLQAGGLELPPDTTILAVLRSLRDADMLSEIGSSDHSYSKPGDAAIAFGFKHASVQTVACHVLSQACQAHIHHAPTMHPPCVLSHLTPSPHDLTPSRATSQELKLKLHRAAAEDCEAQYRTLADQCEASGELLLLLAHHWRRAGGDELSCRNAGRYLMLCGDRAMAAASASEASQHYAEALEIAISLESLRHEVGPLQRRLGECHVQQGNYTAAGKCLDRALLSMGGEELALLQISEKEVKSRLDAVRAQQFRVQAKRKSRR